MADNQYKIELGVKLDTSDLKSEINKIDGKHKVKLGVDLGVKDIQDRIRAYNNNSNNIKVKLKATLDTDDLKKQINKINLSTNVGDGVSIPVNTRSLEESLERVERIIGDVRNSLGTLDDKSSVQSLVASVNQIATALGKAEDESDSLIKSLSALSKKEFGVNLGLDLGKKGNNMVAYGRQARKQVIPQLEAQIKELEGLFGGQQATMRKLTQHGKNVGFDIFTDFEDFNSDSAIKKMEAMEKYIGSLKKLASIDNISLDGFNSKFSKTATDLIDDIAGVDTAVDKASDIPEKLKNIFGSSVNADNLNIQLDDIVANLNDIKVALQGLSSGNPLSGLTQSFDRLSGSIENLLTNAEKVKGIIGGSISNVGVGSTTDTKIKAENIVPDSSELTSSAKQVGKKIGDSIEQSVEQSINLDDVIDKQVLDLMDKFSIAGGNGSKAFNEIKQALEECRLELNILKNSDIGIDEEVFDTSRAVDKVTDAIANQMRAVNDLGDEYIKLADYMTSFNNPTKGNKVRLPDFVKQEQGDDYKSNRGSLGIAFNTEKGISFADFINDLNHELGQTIDLTNGEAVAMDELLRKLELGRQQRDASKKSNKYLTSTASTEEILEQNGISREEIYADTMSIVSVVDAAEDKIAQASTQATNVVAQNEERRQQAYRETSNEYAKISRDISLTRNAESGIDFKDSFDSYNGAAQEAKRHFKELLADEKAVISVTEQFDDNNALQSFAVNVKRANGEVETLRYSMRNLAEEGEDDNWNFVYQGASSNDRSVNKQLESRIKTANKLQTQLEEIKTGYKDMGASKPIKDSDHIIALDKQYRKVEKAIDGIRNADNSMSSSMISNAEKQKSVLESMVKQYRNAETVATSLRSKDIKTVGATYDSDLDVLISKMRKDGVYTSGFEKGANNLRSMLSDAVANRDKDGLVSFLNGLDKLEAGYKRASAAKKEFNRSESVGIDTSRLESRIANLQRIDPEIDKFETKINGADVSVKSLLNDLGKIKTQDDFRVVNKRLNAFEKAAEASGITVKEAKKESEEAKKVNQAYKDIYDTRKKIGSLEVDLIGAEAKGEVKVVKDINDEITRLKSNLATLEKDNIGAQFTDSQKASLKELRKQIQYENKQAKNQADSKAVSKVEKAEAKKVNEIYNNIRNIKKEIGKLEVDLIGAEDIRDAVNLKNRITELKVELSALDADGIYSSKFTDKQKASLDSLEKQIEFNKKQANNKVDIKLETQIEKDEITETERSFKRLKLIAKEISRLDIKIEGLDVNKNANEISELTTQLNNLQSEYNELFVVTSKNLSDSQVNDLTQEFVNASNRLDAVKAKMVDASAFNQMQTETRETEESFKKLINIGKQIDNIEFKIKGLDGKKNVNEIAELKRQLDVAEQSYRNLRNSLQGRLSVNQLEELTNSAFKAEDRFKQLEAVLKDKAVANAQKVEVEKIKNAYDELIKTIKEVGSLKKQIAGLDSIKDSSQISNLNGQLEGLELKYNRLVRSFSDKFDTSQLLGWQRELQKVENNVENVNAKLKDKAVADAQKKQTDTTQVAYKKVLELQKQISSKKVSLTLLDENKDANRINELGRQINILESDYNNLLLAFSHGFSDSQWDEINLTVEKTIGNVREAKAKMTDSSVAQQLRSENKKIENDYKELLAVAKQIDGINLKIGKLDVNANQNEILVLESRLEELGKTYQVLRAELQGKLPDGQLASLSASVFEAKSNFEQLDAKFADTRAKLANEIKIKLSDTGFDGFEQEVQRAHAEAEKLEYSTDELESALRELDVAMEAVYSADQSGDIKRLVSANEEYESSLKKFYSQLKLNQQAKKDAYKAEMLEQKKASLSSEMEIWLKENTKATRDFGEEIKRLQASLNGLDDRGVNLVGKQFKNITKQAQAMGKTGLTVFDKLKSKAKEYMTYLSAAELFMYAEQAFRSMFEQVKLIDSAMTELKKVTDETDASYDKFLTNAATRAKEIGTTIDGLVASTADFARLGFGFKDAQGLAEVANIYAVVGDDIDSVETATQSLISTLTAFKNEMGDMDNSEFALSIVDKMNEVANNYAISSGGIGDALQRSASSMMAANNSLDETIALITAANTVVQDADSVGRLMPT